MRTPSACAVALAIGGLGAAAETADPCAGLESIVLPDTRIGAVENLSAPVPHCKLTGTIGPEIGFSVWLPTGWNGKFVMGGGGGFVGAIQNQALFSGALERGYASAGTDTGHQSAGLDGSWAHNHLERLVNYGHVGIHRVAETAKHIVQAHYGKRAERDLFMGCSNGGRQAMAFSQRYPTSFDGIIAGAPAFDFAGVAAAFVNVSQHMYPDMDDLSAPAMTPDDRGALAAAVLERCDAKDGLADGIMNDPRDCDFDPAMLALPPGKLAAVRAVYDGPTSADGPVHPGWPFGGEDEDGGWGGWLAGAGQQGPGVPPSAAFGFGVDIMRYMVLHDADWRYEGFGYDGFRHLTRTAASVLSATSPDLDAFRAGGGKLLLYHGWSDAALTAFASIDYVEAVYGRDPSARQDVRLFLMPGVLHCAGGPGPWVVDTLDVMERWLDSGEAPETLTAGFADGNGARPLCAHPRRIAYLGGDGRSASSFDCQ